jgi:hypothetical protein
MSRTTLAGLILGACLPFFCGILLASEGDELREKAQALLKEADTLTEQGKKEEAGELREKAEELLKVAKEADSKAKKPKIESKYRLAKPRRDMKFKATEGDESTIRPEIREQAEKLEAATRRIHHLRSAAENLKAAEEHDLAHKLMEKAEDMERDVQEAKRRLAAEIHGDEERRRDFPLEIVRELKAEIERLRAEVRELSQKVEKR